VKTWGKLARGAKAAALRSVMRWVGLLLLRAPLGVRSRLPPEYPPGASLGCAARLLRRALCSQLHRASGSV
jgi:hypothetical protein